MLFIVQNNFIITLLRKCHGYPLADPEGAAGAPPPNGIKFFHFRIRFHQKVPASEVGAPQRLGALPTGNPGSATAIPMAYSLFIFNGRSEVQSVGQRIDSEPN